MLVSNSTIAVRYAETDQMGVVYHGNYLVWLEIARTNLMEELGLPYAQMEAAGVYSPVIDIHLSYKASMTYGQVATVKTWIGEYNGFRVTYRYEVFNEDGKLCVTADSTHVCVSKETFRPLRLSDRFPGLHQAYLEAQH